ncbi:hypothetical protein GCM10027053_12250 [Intrasporangium mesophilum]
MARHAVRAETVNGTWTVKDVSYLPENPASFPLTQVPDAAMLRTALAQSTELAAQIPDVSSNLEPSTYATDVPSPSSEQKADPAGQGQFAALAVSYNYTAMVNYAKYWGVPTRYNPIYPIYPEDCTNFVSQALYAGGWAMVRSDFWPANRSDPYNWFCDGKDSTSASYSWTGANNLKNFMINSGRVRWLSSIWSLGNGDCLGYDWTNDHSVDHWAMCTGHDSAGKPLMTQHVKHYVNKPLSEIVSGQSWAYVAART